MNFIKGLEIPCIKLNDLEAFFQQLMLLLVLKNYKQKTKKLINFIKTLEPCIKLNAFGVFVKKLAPLLTCYQVKN